jgi:aminoglycoside 3-N-acetyltransferase
MPRRRESSGALRVSEGAAIQRILRTCAVPRDAVLTVHSAIGHLSRQGYRAEAMIEALLEYLGNGTVLVPTMTWRTVTPENPVWDEIETPSHTGVLSEVFRTRYATARSLHPTHSVAGTGPLTRVLLSTHQIGNTPVPATSPYGLMRDYPAYILMIGVGLECCTAIHHPEEVIAPDIYLRPMQSAEKYELRSRDGTRLNFQLRRHARLLRDFPKFASLLAAKSCIRAGTLSGVPWTLVKVSDLLTEVFARLIEEPDFNLAASARTARLKKAG